MQAPLGWEAGREGGHGEAHAAAPHRVPAPPRSAAAGLVSPRAAFSVIHVNVPTPASTGKRRGAAVEERGGAVATAASRVVTAAAAVLPCTPLQPSLSDPEATLAPEELGLGFLSQGSRSSAPASVAPVPDAPLQVQPPPSAQRGVKRSRQTMEREERAAYASEADSQDAEALQPPPQRRRGLASPRAAAAVAAAPAAADAAADAAAATVDMSAPYAHLVQLATAGRDRASSSQGSPVRLRRGGSPVRGRFSSPVAPPRQVQRRGSDASSDAGTCSTCNFNEKRATASPGFRAFLAARARPSGVAGGKGLTAALPLSSVVVASCSPAMPSLSLGLDALVSQSELVPPPVVVFGSTQTQAPPPHAAGAASAATQVPLSPPPAPAAAAALASLAVAATPAGPTHTGVCIEVSISPAVVSLALASLRSPGWLDGASTSPAALHRMHHGSAAQVDEEHHPPTLALSSPLAPTQMPASGRREGEEASSQLQPPRDAALRDGDEEEGDGSGTILSSQGSTGSVNDLLSSVAAARARALAAPSQVLDLGPSLHFSDEDDSEAAEAAVEEGGEHAPEGQEGVEVPTAAAAAAAAASASSQSGCSDSDGRCSTVWDEDSDSEPPSLPQVPQEEPEDGAEAVYPAESSVLVKVEGGGAAADGAAAAAPPVALPAAPAAPPPLIVVFNSNYVPNDVERQDAGIDAAPAPWVVTRAPTLPASVAGGVSGAAARLSSLRGGGVALPAQGSGLQRATSSISGAATRPVSAMADAFDDFEGDDEAANAALRAALPLAAGALSSLLSLGGARREAANSSVDAEGRVAHVPAPAPARGPGLIRLPSLSDALQRQTTQRLPPQPPPPPPAAEAPPPPPPPPRPTTLVQATIDSLAWGGAGRQPPTTATAAAPGAAPGAAPAAAWVSTHMAGKPAPAPKQQMTLHALLRPGGR